MADKPTSLVEDLTLVPMPPLWESPWFWLVVVAALLCVVVLGRRWFRRRPATRVEAPVVPETDRTPEFLERLARLRERQATLDAYAVSIESSELLRDYVEWRFRLAIRFQTTREFLDHAARGAEVSQPAAGWLGRYLGFCDRIKFAQGSADAAARSGLLDAAEAFLRHGRLDSAPTQSGPPAEGGGR
jgi:hypothetical protein